MTYRDPRPHTKIGQVRTALMYLLDQRRRDGALPTSVRACRTSEELGLPLPASAPFRQSSVGCSRHRG